MKRGIVQVVLLAVVAIAFFASCKKDYHCQCSYNNQVMLVKDLGSQVHGDAQTTCNGYDSTVTGEKWNCVIY